MTKTWLLPVLMLVVTGPVLAERPIVIAHRGASGYLPEHTLAAKALAHAQGADFLEQDVVLTSDGVPIVSHDIHLDRVTDVALRFPERARPDSRYYAIDFSWPEIQQLRVVERVNEAGKAAYPDRFPTGTPLFRIVSLKEELQFIQGLNRSTGRNVGIYVELKQPAFHHREGQDLSLITLGILRTFGYEAADDQCFVQCFEEAELRRLREKLQTELRLIQLVSDGKEWQSLLQNPTRLERRLQSISEYADGIGPSLSLVVSGGQGDQDFSETPLVPAAHRAGLEVHGWTFRSDQLSCGAKDFGQLHRWTQAVGLDGYFTDFPDKTVHFLRDDVP